MMTEPHLAAGQILPEPAHPGRLHSQDIDSDLDQPLVEVRHGRSGHRSLDPSPPDSWASVGEQQVDLHSLDCKMAGPSSPARPLPVPANLDFQLRKSDGSLPCEQRTDQHGSHERVSPAVRPLLGAQSPRQAAGVLNQVLPSTEIQDATNSQKMQNLQDPHGQMERCSKKRKHQDCDAAQTEAAEISAQAQANVARSRPAQAGSARLRRRLGADDYNNVSKLIHLQQQQFTRQVRLSLHLGS